MSTGKKLRELRKEKNATLQDVADLFGIHRSAVSHWETEKTQPDIDRLRTLARYFGTSVEEILGGTAKAGATSNVAPGPDILGRLPLISWVKAGELCDSNTEILPADAEEWFFCPVPHGPNAYCLRVLGESMDDGTRDSYRDGDILFVDPDRGARSNDDVIARDPEGRTTFKRLKEDAEGPYLLALNGKRILRVPEGTVFCAVVIFSGVKRA